MSRADFTNEEGAAAAGTSSAPSSSAGSSSAAPAASLTAAPGSVAMRPLVPFALYAVALGIVCAVYPYRPALDDNEWLYLARSVAENGRLAGDSVFMRVPGWQWMLGSAVGWAGDRGAVLGLQAACIGLVFFLLARYRISGAADASPSNSSLPRPSIDSATAVALLVAVSPQFVLYSRHAVTELWVGAVAMAAVVLGERVERFDARRAGALGAVVAVAAMIKLAALVLWLPCLVYLHAARDRLPATRGLGAFSAGFALAIIPMLAVVALQRGLPLDDTSAFTLSPIGIEAWEAAGGSAARSALAMQAFWELVAADPIAYLAGAASRAVEWFVWPSSLDLLIWIPEYPALVVESLDHVVFFAVVTLAALGTTRRSWPAWIFPVAVWAACSIGQKTPHSPKVTALLPLLLLAPAGLDFVRGRAR